MRDKIIGFAAKKSEFPARCAAYLTLVPERSLQAAEASAARRSSPQPEVRALIPQTRFVILTPRRSSFWTSAPDRASA